MGPPAGDTALRLRPAFHEAHFRIGLAQQLAGRIADAAQSYRAAVALNADSNAPKQAKVLSKPFHLREIVAEVDRMIAA